MRFFRFLWGWWGGSQPHRFGEVIPVDAVWNTTSGVSGTYGSADVVGLYSTVSSIGGVQ